jgi:(S)-ureidoglycine aminohydrolase
VHNLGQTRSAQQLNHLLLTPDTFVRTALPGMKNCVAVVHAGPAVGAKFTQYTAEFESGGCLGDTSAQRLIYVLEGQVELELDGRESELSARGCAYLPQGAPHRVTASRATRAAIIEKFYQPVSGIEGPRAIVSSEDAVESHALGDDPWLQVKCLLPDTMQFDFAVNTMTYQPGAALSMVEMHWMEHGLLMLEGGGIYRLGDAWYPVTAGDFIWMAPWCPQWFGAIGKTPAKYLIYKDWNRHPLTPVQSQESDALRRGGAGDASQNSAAQAGAKQPNAARPRTNAAKKSGKGRPR